jgi:prolyl-tRNA synthetase
MTFSRNFIKTKKEVSKDIESKNGRLLTQAGYISMQLAGAYNYLPLGLITLRKISDIVRKHMNEISSEVLMTELQPIEIWEKTKRLETVDVLMKTTGASELSKTKSTNEYILGCTSEDTITDMVKSFVQGSSELPVYLYQVQTKFRNEARAKSGLMRGREFLMKDLYSFNKSKEELMDFYEICKQKYVEIFNEIGIGEDTFITLASGGDFTSNFSHEFQLVLDSGEDTIYLDRKNKIAYNKEIINEENSKKLGVNFSELEIVNASEVGNIFPLETKFSSLLDFTYTDEFGETQLVWMGSYGIGISRLMGVVAEKFNDEKGLIWPENIAPFKYHLVTIARSMDDESYNKSIDFYNSHPGEVLWDDRIEVRPGEKFAVAELIGIPNIVIISEKSINSGGYELKNRKTGEGKIVKF